MVGIVCPVSDPASTPGTLYRPSTVCKPPLHKMMRCGPVMDLLTVYGLVIAQTGANNVNSNDKASFRLYFHEIEDS